MTWNVRVFGRNVAVPKSVAVAVAFSALSVLGAKSFARKPPPVAAPPAGMKVNGDGVTLASNAPQWHALKLGKARAAGPQWTDPVTAEVRIDDTEAARVGSPLAGRVNEVYVVLGQSVKKGDPLFSVTSTDLASLRSDAAKASVDLDLAKAQYQRVHDMVQSRLLPGKDELAATADRRQAELALHGAEAKLRALRVKAKRDNEFTVTAPRDGVVVQSSLLPSQEVGTDGALLQIADTSRVWVVADVFEDDVAGLRAGSDARIELPAHPGKIIDAKIDSVSAVVDPGRRSVPVRVRLDNAGHELRPNELAEMRFRVALPPGSVTIPASSLVSDGAKQSVFVEDAPGKLVRRTVLAGPVRDGEVAISRGLKVGETVVEQGGILLDNQIELSH